MTSTIGRILTETISGEEETLTALGSELYEEQEEDEDNSGAILITVLVLLLATIAFERVKEWLEERAHKTFEPVVEKLFGELAVLGFLSLCTFCFAQTHFFNYVASGRLDEEDIEEIVEMTHYVLFFVVLSSVVNVCTLIAQAETIMNRWEKFDKLIHIHGADAFLKRNSHRSKKSLARNVLPDLAEDSLFMKFCALQEEFHLNRDLNPPFAPAPLERRLDENFNFAAYLAKCLEQTLEEIVELQEPTYLFFAAFAIFFYGYNNLLQHNTRVLSWIWVSLNYGAIGFNAWFIHHLSDVADALGTNSDWLIKRASLQDVGNQFQDPLLPRWCSIDWTEEDHHKHHNRQAKLYLFEEKWYIIVLQTTLVFSSIYWALLFIAYFPFIYKEYGVLHLFLYAMVALIPSKFLYQQWVSILALLTEVLSVGHLRRPKNVASVIRDQKIESMIRSFLLIRRVDEFVKSLEDTNGNAFGASVQRSLSSLDLDGSDGLENIKRRNESFASLRSAQSSFSDMDNNNNNNNSSRRDNKRRDKIIRKRVQIAFNAIDQNGDGHLDESEFEELMKSLGMPVTHEMGQKIVEALDMDGNGVIDIHEMEAFYKAIMTDRTSPHKMAKDLFVAFDLDGTGLIHPNEFAQVLEGLNMGFGPEDIGQILQEIDEDGDGEITFHEFERVIEEYMPPEFFENHEDDDDVEDDLAVHPVLIAIEGLVFSLQNMISNGNRTEEDFPPRRRSVTNTRRSILNRAPAMNPSLLLHAGETGDSYGSLIDSTDVSDESD